MLNIAFLLLMQNNAERCNSHCMIWDARSMHGMRRSMLTNCYQRTICQHRANAAMLDNMLVTACLRAGIPETRGKSLHDQRLASQVSALIPALEYHVCLASKFGLTISVPY